MSSQNSNSEENVSPYIHQDGYEISFVKDPPQELQLECSICLQLLSDPCLLDCECGSSFCRKCIKTIQSHKSPCPLCNEKFKIVLPNKQLQRTLNSLLVHCPHSDKGCSWVNEMAKVSQHFNQLPIEGTRLEGCEHIAIPCRFCEKPFPRKSIPQHETELCPNKPYTCQYCGHESILNDITENHWPVCDKFPLPCPYECGDSPPREELESHVMSVCELAPIECEFKYAGCEVGELPRKEMAVHLRENLVKHTSLLAIKQREEVETLRMENQNLKASFACEMETLHVSFEQEIETLKKENQSLRTNFASVKQECDTLKSRVECENTQRSRPQVQNLASSMSLLPAPTPPRTRVPPVELVMNNVKRLKEQRNRWSSPPFYSEEGYKMLLSVYPFGNGSGSGTHLSAFVHLLKGEYDDALHWPFRGEVLVTLIDQRFGRHYSKEIDFTNYEGKYGEKRYNNSLDNGLGLQEFIEYKYLNPNYLCNDCLIFRIDDITNTMCVCMC